MAAAVIERFEIVQRRPAFGGARFGTSGDYEFIRAKAHVRLAADHPANRGIIDLDRAPQTADRQVRYTADVVILRPRAATGARRVLIAEVPNRGLRLSLNSLNGQDAVRERAAVYDQPCSCRGARPG